MVGSDGNPAPGVFGVADLPVVLFLVEQPADESRHRIGQALLDSPLRHPTKRSVGGRRRQRDQAGLAGARLGVLFERNIIGLAGRDVSRHLGSEGGVDELLQRPHGAEALGQRDDAHAPLPERLAQPLVKGDVGAAKSIDRLFGIAHQEQLAGERRNVPPVRLLRIIRSEKQEDLSLQRVSILKLVHKDVLELVLQVFADRAVLDQEIADLEKEVDKIQFAARPLHFVIAIEQLSHFGLQQGRQVSVSLVLEILESPKQVLSAVDHVLASHILGVNPASFPFLAALQVTEQLDQEAFERVVIAVCNFFGAADGVRRIAHRTQVFKQIVFRALARRTQLGQIEGLIN